MNPAPSASRETATPPPKSEPPQVVEQTDDPNAGDEGVERSVQQFLQNVQLAKKGRAKPQSELLLADVQPAADPDPDAEVAPPPARAKVTPEAVSKTESEEAKSEPVATAPPALSAVSVYPGSAGFKAKPNEPQGPAVNGAATARSAPHSLRDFMGQAVPPEDASFRDQLDTRVLWLIAGDYDRAREPLKLVTAEQQNLAAHFVDALIAIREGHAGDMSAAATTAAHELAVLTEDLRKLSELSVPTLKICSAVRGFGQFDEIEPARFLAGGSAEFVLYCEVRDFVSEHREDGLYYTRFDLTTTILNRAGDTVLDLKDPDITDRCRNRRQDCFIPRLVRLPASLSPGQYVAKVTVTDKLGQKVAENRASFQLTARP
jgi:hypothetical protein